jgi:hypothetical protein
MALSQEQNLIQGLYQNLSNNSFGLLSGLVKQKLVGTSLAASVPPFPASGNLYSAAERWQYGMRAMGYNVNASQMPSPGIKYEPQKD